MASAQPVDTFEPIPVPVDARPPTRFEGAAEGGQPLPGYVRGAGIEARWVVIHGNPDVFRVTDQIEQGVSGTLVLTAL